MKHLLIDGDILLYQCGFAAEKTYYLVNDLEAYREFDTFKEAKEWYATTDKNGKIWSRKEVQPLENCLQMVKTTLESGIFKIPDTESYTIFLSGKRNFREDLYADYKANRLSMPKPKHYRDVKNYLIRQYGAVVSAEGLEADDEISIKANEMAKEKKPYIVVSTDKDLKQVPGEHYNQDKKEFFVVGQRDAISFFYQQLLSGDDTDNIDGIAGIGRVTAAKLIDPCKTPKEMAEVVYAEYQKATKDEMPNDIIDMNAKLVWILRSRKSEHPFWKHLGRDWSV
jgi:5'-3' exonuclease